MDINKAVISKKVKHVRPKEDRYKVLHFNTELFILLQLKSSKLQSLWKAMQRNETNLPYTIFQCALQFDEYSDYLKGIGGR